MSLCELYDGLQLPEVDIEQFEMPEGFRESVTLFRYQQEALLRMQEREEVTSLFTDPLWSEEKHGEQTKYMDEKGGILCEEMGSGKTIVCLALILSTYGKHAVPPPLYRKLYSAAPEFTISLSQVAFENVGGIHYTSEIQKQWKEPVATEESQPQKAYECADEGKVTLPSLAELASRVVRDEGGAVLHLLPSAMREYISSLPPAWYDVFHERGAHTSTSFRASAHAGARRMLLSKTSLVIVPPALMEQWVGEVRMHVRDHYLRVLVVDRGPLPSPSALASFDLVLITLTRLRAEEGQAQSPLLGVRFMRMIVDEGHVMGRSASAQVKLAMEISAERRWCCTGTPTPATKIGTELTCLHALMRFIRQEPYLSSPKVWNTAIAAPLKRGDPAARAKLVATLERVMIRHSRVQVQREIRSPTCTVETSWLAFSSREQRRYNEIVLGIRLNLLTSLSRGVDSLAHQCNRRHAKLALQNVQQACFYTPGLYYEELSHGLESAHDTIRRKVLKSDEDIKQMNILRQWLHYLLINHRPPDPLDIQYSTKLKYLFRRLSEETPNHKCIVYSQYDSVLAHVIQMLEDFNDSVRGGPDAEREMRFLEFHSKIPMRQRSQTLVTFNTSQSIRVLVMKTQLAAFGINIPSASRIFFMDVVWDESVERQAIKRADRLGQTKNVKVEKLLMAQTIEEDVQKLLSQGIKDSEHTTLSLLKELKFAPVHCVDPPPLYEGSLSFMGNRKRYKKQEVDEELADQDQKKEVPKVMNDTGEGLCVRSPASYCLHGGSPARVRIEPLLFQHRPPSSRGSEIEKYVGPSDGVVLGEKRKAATPERAKKRKKTAASLQRLFL